MVQELILFLTHIMGGAIARVSEVAMYKIWNTEKWTRNVYAGQELAALLGRYNTKGAFKVRDTLIPRLLDEETFLLLIEYSATVRPLEEITFWRKNDQVRANVILTYCLWKTEHRGCRSMCARWSKPILHVIRFITTTWIVTVTTIQVWPVYGLWPLSKVMFIVHSVLSLQVRVKVVITSSCSLDTLLTLGL